MSAALAARALAALRRARDDMGYHHEQQAVAFAEGWLVQSGVTPEKARAAVARAWQQHFVAMGAA